MTEPKFDLPQILEQHALWLKDKSGCRAILTGANLREAKLSHADLRWADMRDANLSRADLIETDMRLANLRGANLSDADLSGANLWRANLHGADLSSANLAGANLNGANLREADLSGADLRGWSVIDGGQRSDGHRFVGNIVNNVLMIAAGCRYFSIEDARAHWIYSRSGTPLGDETMCILDHIEALAVLRGLLPPQVKP